jgi:integrase
MKLTKVNLSKIAVPPGKAEIIEFDDGVPGFGLRIRVGGSATWIFQYRQGSKQRRLSLGSASAISAQNARERATELHARVRLGQDPAGEKIESRTRAVETLGSILRPFLLVKKAALKPRSYEQVERHLLVHVKRLHGLQTTAIDRRAIATLLTELAANNGAALANSVRASLSAFFSWAMREGLADSNPIIGTNKAVVTKARDRVLSDDELGRDYVFGTGANGYLGFSNYKLALDARIAAKGSVSPWRLHDLRRTVSTRMHDELGIAPHIVEAVLNHISGHRAGVAGVYNRALYAKEKAVALARWGEHLGAIVSGRSSKVVAMPKGGTRR